MDTKTSAVETYTVNIRNNLLSCAVLLAQTAEPPMVVAASQAVVSLSKVRGQAGGPHLTGL